MVDYQDVETDIITKLAPLVQAGYLVIAQPENEDDGAERTVKNVRITVGYAGSTYDKMQDTKVVRREEVAKFEIAIQSRKRYGAGGILNILKTVKQLLVGYRPRWLEKLRPDEAGYVDKVNGVFTYSLIVSAITTMVEDTRYDTETLITQITVGDAVTVEPPADDETRVTIINTDGDNLVTTDIPNGVPAFLIAPDGTIEITDGVTVYGTFTVPAGSVRAGTITIPPGTTSVTIRNTAGTVILSATITNGTPANLSVPDGSVTINDGVNNYGPYLVPAAAGVTQVITLTTILAANTAAAIKAGLDASTKSASVQQLLLNDYGVGFMAGKQFGTLNSSVTGIKVYGSVVYICNGTANAVMRLNATTYVVLGNTTGFTRAFKLAFKADGSYAVTNFTGNSVRLLNSLNIQTAVFAVVTAPAAIEFNATDDGIYVAPFSGGGTITKYSLLGISQGTVSGFQANIVAILKVGIEYWVLSTDNSANQTIRKMRFGDDTQISLIALDTATNIGVVRDMVVSVDRIYVVTDTNTILEYTHTGVFQRRDHVGITQTFGLCQNPNKRNNLLATSPSSPGFAVNIIHP